MKKNKDDAINIYRVAQNRPTKTPISRQKQCANVRLGHAPVVSFDSMKNNVGLIDLRRME